ncbi:MAG: hypothetical protein SH850_10110 [Planctomycetaceae bacterium]|nr:hypothetical protein [Planctomycetaceae bacterium]
MLTPFRRVVFQAFIVILGIWTGAGIHDTLMNHFAWWADPLAYVRERVLVPGIVNPWPFTTGIFSILTLTALASFARYRGEAKRAVMAVLVSAVMVLAVTGVYFVPQLGRMADPALPDADLLRYSKDWIRFNAARIVFLIGLFYFAVSTLARMSKAA